MKELILPRFNYFCFYSNRNKRFYNSLGLTLGHSAKNYIKPKFFITIPATLSSWVKSDTNSIHFFIHVNGKVWDRIDYTSGEETPSCVEYL